ncbi:MAG: porin family protein [Chitinophagaceae bacterium]
MKNLLLILQFAGFTFCTVPVHSQLVAGFKGGINYAGFSNHDGGKRLSGHTGIFIHSRFNTKWHIQPELLYSAEGQRYTVTEIAGEIEQETERTVAVNVASVPVMFQYFVTPAFSVEAGPQLSFIISATDKGTNEKLNVKRSLANTQFGLNAGMGLMVSKRAGFYVRYCFGLTDLTRFDDNADYNRVVQAGFLFRMK